MSKIVMSTSMSCFTLCDKNDLQEGGSGAPQGPPLIYPCTYSPIIWQDIDSNLSPKYGA